ncbi:sortase [Candidatus Kaiserbacteria bacterium]|nr:sortase [Candidatus Kaiserbacteria bacterium]MCB9812640.1 sortase [Candidatus Nomurabacteria bacterium]
MNRIWQQKGVFLGTFFVVFTLSYIVLLALDFLPEPPNETPMAVQETVDTPVVIDDLEEDVAVIAADTADVPVLVAHTEAEVSDASIPAVGELPVQLSIPKLNKTVAVLNPASRTITDLDAALLDGVVRHPDSATLSQTGNVFILGHSSYLPTVFNRNFQAFNGIQNLAWGDTIEVTSDTAVYVYRVEKVYRARAQDVTVPIANTGKMLTLATCNSFGSVDDRYIVEAKQIAVKRQ